MAQDDHLLKWVGVTVPDVKGNDAIITSGETLAINHSWESTLNDDQVLILRAIRQTNKTANTVMSDVIPDPEVYPVK